MVDPRFEPRQLTLQANFIITTIVGKDRSLGPFWVMALMQISVAGAVRTPWGREWV